MDKQTVTAYPIVQDVPALLSFLARVYAATESERVVGSAGGYHAEVQIGDTQLMIGGGGPDVNWKGEVRPMAFHIYVPDVDATYKLAISSGGKSLQGPIDQEWGERTAHVVDPAGNLWYIATFKRANYFSDGAPTVQPFLQPLHSEPIIDFLACAFGAVEEGRAATDDGVILHSTLKLGSSALEFGDAHDEYVPMPGMFYVAVEDADAAYARAIKCGGESHSPAVDQSYGARTASVKDVAGNVWYVAGPLAR